VRAKSSGRRLRRDLRGLAYAGTRLAEALCVLEGVAKLRIRRGADALARGGAAAVSARLPRGRPRLPEPQTQDLLRAQMEALRRHLSRFLRRRPASALRGHRGAGTDQGQLLSAPDPAPAA